MANTLRWAARKSVLVLLEGYSDAVAEQIVQEEQLAEARAKGLLPPLSSSDAGGQADRSRAEGTETPTDRDERWLSERERWMGDGRKAKTWDQQRAVKEGISTHEVKRRLDAARRRRREAAPKATPFSGLGGKKSSG